MNEQALLLVFIGLVSLALVAIAAAIVFVAWRLVKLLEEVHSITQDLHNVGRSVAGDVQGLRENIKKSEHTLAEFISHLVRSFIPPSRRKIHRKTKEEVQD